MWLEEGEIEAMAQRIGMEPDAFVQAHVRTVPDGDRGGLRLSLREQDEGAGGRCSLLEGNHHCTVYEARPKHCRTFPYWPSVLEDEAGFERARATCPGIAVVVSDEVRQEAFRRLESLYAEVDAFVERSRAVCIARGVCCRFEEAGHELFSTGLEADYAASLKPVAPPPEAAGRCAYHVAGRCTARAGRPLGCRTYFCDANTSSVLEEAHEHFLRGIRVIETETGYPTSYARFPELLASRAEFSPEAGGQGGKDLDLAGKDAGLGSSGPGR